MAIELKIYLSSQGEYDLCFHATFNSKNDYEVYYELNNTYRELMVNALEGKLCSEYIIKDDFDKHKYEINMSNYQDDFNSFVEFLTIFYKLQIK